MLIRIGLNNPVTQKNVWNVKMIEDECAFKFRSNTKFIEA